MVKEILYTTAIDKNGNLIHINDAKKGVNYYCPNPDCEHKEFILRKSEKKGKGSRRTHFAHKELSPRCKPERVLHESFKKMLKDLLEKYKSESKELILNWYCSECFIKFSRERYKANLLAKTDRIIEEYNLKACQPDIVLLDAKGKVGAAIEIVVSHKPEENVLQYYEENGIILIQINLYSHEDLDKVEDKIANPDIVNFCLNLECLNFRNYTSERRLAIIETRCKRHSHPMRTCHVEVDSFFGTIRITTLNEEEIKEAQSKGVQFRIMQDKTTKRKHTVIVCPTCEHININKMSRIKIVVPRRNYRNRPFD